MATVDELLVKIDASTELLRRELKKGDKSVQGFERNVSSRLDRVDRKFKGLGRSIRTGLAALGVGLSIRGIQQFARSTIAAGDSIDKASKTAGIAAENLQELRFAFGQLAGTTDKEVDESIRRFNRRLGLAIQGMGEAKTTFALMGIEFRDQAGNIRATDDVLEEVLENLAKIESDSIRAARASQVFGEDAGPRLAAALGEGVEAMNDLREATPGVISNENVKLAADLTDKFAEMAKTVGGTLANAFIEATGRAAEFFGLIDLSPEKVLEIEERGLNRLLEQLQRDLAEAPPGARDTIRESIASVQRQIDFNAQQQELQRRIAAGAGGFPRGPGGFEFGGSGSPNQRNLLQPQIDAVFRNRRRNENVEIRRSRLAGPPPEDTGGGFASINRQIEAAIEVIKNFETEAESTTENVASRWEQMSNTIGFSLRSTLSDVFRGVEVDFGEMIRRMAADFLASGLLQAIGGAIGGPFGTAIAVGAGGIASRDSGGPVTAGKSYYSGVPEVFTPSFSGMATPVSQMGSVSVYQNIRFDVGLESVDNRIALAAPKIAEYTKAGIRESRARRQ